MRWFLILITSLYNIRYNFSGTDHHPLVAGQPILDASDAASIDEEYASRMRFVHNFDFDFDRCDTTPKVMSLDKGLRFLADYDRHDLSVDDAHLKRDVVHLVLHPLLFSSSSFFQIIAVGRRLSSWPS